MKKKNVKQMLSRIVACCLSMTMVMGLVTVPTGFAVSLTDTIIDENFDSTTPGGIPAGFERSGEGGSTAVGTYLGKTGVQIKNEYDGKYIMLSKSFNSIKNGVFDISFSFLQPKTASEATIISLFNDESTEFVKVITKDGRLWLETAAAAQTILEQYQTDKWYDIKLWLNFVTGKIEITVDGSLECESSFTNASASFNKVAFYTEYSPGFYIDDLKVIKTTNTNRLVIEGPQFVSVPNYGANEFKFNAYMRDENGAALTETPISWEIVNSNGADLSGVDLVAEGDYGMSASLSLTDEVPYRGIIELKATYAGDGAGEEPPTSSFYVSLTDEVISSLEITGPVRIKNGLDDSERAYEVTATDTNGDIANYVEKIWYLGEGAPSYASIDEDGILHVSETITTDVQIKVCVKIEGSYETAEKTVVLQTEQNYDNDMYRLERFKKSMDTAIKVYTDPYSGTAHLASYLDVRTMKPLAWKQIADQPTIANTNLATDSMIYRCMDFLTAFTGDEKYSDIVEEVYQWYLDYGLADNGMGYWGGHASVDLKTLEPVLAPQNYNTHEFKEHYMYWDPFYRLDEEAGYELCRNVMLGHVTDWAYMLSNRHASYGKELDESIWTNLDAFAADYRLLPTTYEQPFKNMACDMAYAAGLMYKYTGDEYAKEWGMRFFKCYAELADETTGIMPTVYTTGRGAENVNNPDSSIQAYAPTIWWQVEDIDEAFTTVAYGDRFYNQFAVDLVKQGFYPEEALDPYDLETYFGYSAEEAAAISKPDPDKYKLYEGYYKSNASGSYMINDMAFAKAIGTDTPDGRYVVEKIVKQIAGYLDYAWVKGDNEFKYIMADGTDISTFVPDRNGYYGNYYGREKELGTYTIPASFFEACVYAYTEAVKREDLAEEAAKMFEFINFAAREMYGFGTFGSEEFGDSGMKINYTTNVTSYNHVMALTDLYYATGQTEFLDLARIVANNFIKSNWKWGMLVGNTGASISPGSAYVLPINGSGKYYYALSYLEAAIIGMNDLVPRVQLMGSGYHDQYVHENGVVTREYDGTTFLKLKNPSVYVQDIIFETENVTLSPGEKTTLKYTVLPTDASSKSITYWITNNMVATVNKTTGEITAVSPGTTELICISGDLKVNKTIKITVR